VFHKPTPELPDDMLIENVEFSTRIKNALNTAGVKTVGEVREASDKTLLSFRGFWQTSVEEVRKGLGLPPVR
jgi:DNA-directed RNA polymerase alpha subunit